MPFSPTLLVRLQSFVGGKTPQTPRFATGKVVDDAQDVDQEVKLSKTSSTVVAVEARANLKVDSSLFLVFIAESTTFLEPKVRYFSHPKEKRMYCN